MNLPVILVGRDVDVVFEKLLHSTEPSPTLIQVNPSGSTVQDISELPGVCSGHSSSHPGANGCSGSYHLEEIIKDQLYSDCVIVSALLDQTFDERALFGLLEALRSSNRLVLTVYTARSIRAESGVKSTVRDSSGNPINELSDFSLGVRSETVPGAFDPSNESAAGRIDRQRMLGTVTVALLKRIRTGDSSTAALENVLMMNRRQKRSLLPGFSNRPSSD